MRTLIKFCLGTVIFGSTANARVFSFKDSGLAAYVRGTLGQSNLDQDAFANSNGSTSVNGHSRFQYGGDLGAMLAFTERVHLRLGAEVIQHSVINKARGTDEDDHELYRLESSVFVFNPNLALEYVYSGAGSLRYFGDIGVGLANVTVVNSYKMTAAGESKFGVEDHDEKMEANVLSAQVGGGLEVLFTDNVTFMLEGGYRYLPVSGLKYKGNAETIMEPSGVAKGGDVKNSDGSARTLDLSGFFVGATFRFYLNFL